MDESKSSEWSDGKFGTERAGLPVKGDTGHLGLIQGGFAAAVPLRRAGIELFDRELIGFLKALVQPHGPTLELGAATGILTGQLTRARVDVLACEHDELAIAQLRRSIPYVPTVCAEIDSIPLRDSSVGSILFVGLSPVSTGRRVPGGPAGAQAQIRPGGDQSDVRSADIPEVRTSSGDGTSSGDRMALAGRGEVERVLRPGGLVIDLSPIEPLQVRRASTPTWPSAHVGFSPVDRRLFDDMLVDVWRMGGEV